MEGKHRSASSVSMIFAFFCLFLPFLTLSCPGGSVTVTGMDVATGSEAKRVELFGHDSSQKIPGLPLGKTALVLTVAAALLSLFPGRASRIATGAIAAVNLVLLLLLKAFVDHFVVGLGGGLIQVTWRAGFWLLLLCQASTAVLVFLSLRSARAEAFHSVAQQAAEEDPQAQPAEKNIAQGGGRSSSSDRNPGSAN